MIFTFDPSHLLPIVLTKYNFLSETTSKIENLSNFTDSKSIYIHTKMKKHTRCKITTSITPLRI